MKPLALIVAMTPDRVIGHAGSLPWHISEDLKYFKKRTVGHAIIMGRKTYESVGRALPKRRNIVVSRMPNWRGEGCEHATSIPDAIRMARETDPCPMVIGGGHIYEAALPFITQMFITEVHRTITGDTRFPEYDATAFKEVSRQAAAEHDDVFFVELVRLPRSVT